VRYIDAGYAVALGTLFLYTLSLFFRRRQLTRLEARVTERERPERG
jgi:hypothetical protein